MEEFNASVQARCAGVLAIPGIETTEVRRLSFHRNLHSVPNGVGMAAYAPSGDQSPSVGSLDRHRSAAFRWRGYNNILGTLTAARLFVSTPLGAEGRQTEHGDHLLPASLATPGQCLVEEHCR
jgi:hypothetical protein